MKHQTSVALVDDHVLLRNGLASLVKSFGEYTVLFEANNGKHFIEQLQQLQQSHPRTLPDVVLLDINMPEMDGYDTALWLKKMHPEVKVLALSMYDNENAIIRMFKAGAKGYILKDCDPQELRTALDSIVRKGYYYSEMVTGRLIHTINQLDEEESNIKQLVQLNEREIEFLKLACTEMTYKEIADRMFLSPRTIDGYRDALFEKLSAKTRV
ncbi:MAG TPA: response regulator transcription factor, partial [Chitinophagaceae bacterium]|nr:response regulator transcription factor [Chitinophagaceae bacterium]